MRERMASNSNADDTSSGAQQLRDSEERLRKSQEQLQRLFNASPLQIVVSKQADIGLDLEPVTIEADATQIRQVAMNLITNASDALEGKVGTINLRTGQRDCKAAELRCPFLPDELPAGRYAFLEVEDNGCGMTEETLGKIFDPFFTTKFTGRGLGLAAVLGIVRRHQGTIIITSTPQRGSVFRVLLPMF